MLDEQAGKRHGVKGRQKPTAKIVVGLVGPDIHHLDTGGGTAAMSKRIVEDFAENDAVAVIPIRNYYSFSTWRRISAALDAVWQIWKRRRQLTVVHIQVTGGLSIERDLLLALMAKLVSLPVVVQFHGAGQSIDYDRGSALHRLCYRKLLSISRIAAVLGNHAQDWINRTDSTVATRIIGNSVDIEDSVLPLPGEVPQLVFAGRLGQRKGIYDLLKALEGLAQDGLVFAAHIAGDGEVDEVSNLVAQNKWLNDRVEVLGWQTSSAVREMIIQSWLFVLPSYAEGMPLSVLEAMGCGRAVVATRVNEMDQLVSDGVSGILISPGVVDELAYSIGKICRDKSLAEEMGRQGWDIARSRFSEQRLIDALVELWTDASS